MWTDAFESIILDPDEETKRAVPSSEVEADGNYVAVKLIILSSFVYIH